MASAELTALAVPDEQGSPSSSAIIDKKRRREDDEMVFTSADMDIIKNTFCKGCTPDEVRFFLTVCQKTGLNPILKEVYAIKRGGTLTIQTSIDGLRYLAMRTGEYRGCKIEYHGLEGEWTDAWIKPGPPMLAKASVCVKRDGASLTFEAVAKFSEFNADSPLWKKMPMHMLAKCAEALALRRAFPRGMASIYTHTEMMQAGGSELVDV